MPTIARRNILCLLTCMTLLTSFSLKTQKVIFFGDSITYMGARPGGYIVRMKDALDKKNLGSDYDLIGAGIGGNKVYDLYLRMDDDVLAQNPDIVFIWIGVNDVWHKTMYATGTDADKFEKFYTAIINKCLDRHIRLFLVTPAVIGKRRTTPTSRTATSMLTPRSSATWHREIPYRPGGPARELPYI